MQLIYYLWAWKEVKKKKKGKKPRHNVNICFISTVVYSRRSAKCAFLSDTLKTCMLAADVIYDTEGLHLSWQILEIYLAALMWNVTLTLVLSFNHSYNMKHVSRGFLEALSADVTLLWNAFSGENKLKWSRKWQRWGDSNYEWQRNTFAACLGLPMLRPDSDVCSRMRPGNSTGAHQPLPHYF